MSDPARFGVLLVFGVPDLCQRGLRAGLPRSGAWDTRVGTIDLAVPKLRTGSYYPSWLLEPRRRAEQALVAVVADCYLAGVSTRRVDKLVMQIGNDQSASPRRRRQRRRLS